MRRTARSSITTPEVEPAGTGAPASMRRVLVPVSSLAIDAEALALGARVGLAAGGSLRLVHVRMWDRPIPRAAARFFPETSEEATAALETAIAYVWALGAAASGVVVEAERSRMACAVIAEASRWEADVMVLTTPPRRLLTLGPWERANRLIVRTSACPVLLARPRHRRPCR